MRLLALALCFLAGTANAAVNPDTTALYNFEQGLTSDTGSYNATAVGVAYPTAGAWAGTYAVSHTASSDSSYVDVPISAFQQAKPVSGTIEVSVRMPAAINYGHAAHIFSMQAGVTQRYVALIVYLSNLYIYSEGVINTPILTLSANTNYYFKTSFDTTHIEVYGGTWSTPGSATLTRLTYTAAPTTSVNSSVLRLFTTTFSPANFEGNIDFLRVKPAADFTSSVTSDAGAVPSQLSPYIRQGLFPYVSPWRAFR